MTVFWVVQLKNPADGTCKFLCQCNDELVAQIIRISLKDTILAENADVEVERTGL